MYFYTEIHFSLVVSQNGQKKIKLMYVFPIELVWTDDFNCKMHINSF